MSNVIEIELPGATKGDAQALCADLKHLTDVRATDVVQPKAVDPTTLTLWVQLAAAVLPVLSSIVGLVRGRGLKKVRLRVGEKTVELDEASPADLEKVLAAMKDED